jgi:hypothetical protein
MYKIDNKWCIASYYETYTSVTAATTFSALPTDSNYMHQTYGCFTPNLDLAASFPAAPFLAVALLALLGLL